MNDKLKNLTIQPDPEVWEKIDKSLRRRRALRLTTTAVAGLALLAAVITGVVLWPSQQPAAKFRYSDNQMFRCPDSARWDLEPSGADAARWDLEPSGADAASKTKETMAAAARWDLEPSGADAASKTKETMAAAARWDLEPSGADAALQNEGQQPMAEETQHAPHPVASPVSKAAELVAARWDQEPSGTDAASSVSRPAAVKSPSSNRLEDTILWIPNAFMPASDDAAVAVFRPRLTVPDASISNYKMTIFNRGGHIVFTSRDISTGWDGTYHGEEQVQAAYVYVIQYTDRENIQHQRRGTVIIAAVAA